jgi:hypothetical protein
MLLGAAVLVAVCAGFEQHSESRSEAALGEPREPAMDFSAPLAGAGLQVASGQAADLLPFTPVDVSVLGTPKATFVTNPQASRPSDRVVAWTFNTSKYGTFDVVEEVSQTTQAELESLAGCDPSTGCEGSWAVDPLASGTNALLIQGSGSTALIWLHNGMRFTVMGPPGVFTPGSAEEIANGLQGAGA